MLSSTSAALTDLHDLAMLDLDGVVYIGAAAVPGAAEHLARARGQGMRVAFITNNASRTPEAVASHLTELGVPAAPHDVVTSAQAAAHVLAQRHGPGARVVGLGGAGLVAALSAAGLEVVGPDDDADAVATGYGPDLPWSAIMRCAVRIRDGLPWVASNTDATFPTEFGAAPGHGVLVDMLARFAGVEPTVAGKPSRPLLDETIRRIGGQRPLMVGDRLDTDIEGASAAGIDSLLVLTGVTGLAELAAAPPALRPTYLAPDLAELLEPQPVIWRLDLGDDGGREVAWQVGAWRAAVGSGRLVVESLATDDPGSEADWWRAAVAASWHHLDTTGAVADITAARVPGAAGVTG